MLRSFGMAGFAALLLWNVGCGGAPATTDEARSTTAGALAPAADRAAAPDPTLPPAAAADAHDPWTAIVPNEDDVHPAPITWVALGADGRVDLGFGDGTRAQHTPGQATSPVLPVARMETGPILALSADGAFAVLASDPPQVARTADGAQVLRLNSIPRIQAAAFVEALDALYVVEPGGRLHIWRNVSALADLSVDRIEAFMNRQLPDFTANMGALQAPLAVDDAGRVAFVADGGQLGYWDPAAPTSLRTLARLEGGAVSIAFAGEDILTIDRAGTLRIVGPGRTGGRAWTRDTTWRCGTAMADGQRGFLVAQDHVAVVDLTDGRVLWQQPLSLPAECTVRLVSTFAVVQSGRTVRTYQLTATDQAAAAFLLFRPADVDALTARAVP